MHENEGQERSKAFLFTRDECDLLRAVLLDEAEAREGHNLDGGDFDLEEIQELRDLAERLRTRWEARYE